MDLLEAQDVPRRQTWVPPGPNDILKMVADRGARFIVSGEDLLDLFVESLNRLQEKLCGETPATKDLWNEVKGGVYRPKSENKFSDYVKQHLDEDLKKRGIVVNREVEIRPGKGSGIGVRTDIHVDAILLGPNVEIPDTITAIIEVKGCWHNELDIAMKDQLIDQYMKEGLCQYGLYLVSWFNCDKWDDEDPRKKKARGIDFTDSGYKFENQATELSESGMQVRAFVMDVSLK